MTEAVQIALIVATGPTLVAIGSLYVAITSDRRQAAAQRLAAQEVAKAAGKVEQVKVKLSETDSKMSTRLTEIKDTGDLTHALVNGAMSAQLQVGALALRRIADLTGHEADIKAAELAETALEEHQAKQPRT